MAELTRESHQMQGVRNPLEQKVAFEPDYTNVIFMSLDCCIKLPQHWWLKTTEVYSVTVLKGRSPKSRCPQGHTPCRGRGRVCATSSVCSWLSLALAPSLQFCPHGHVASPFSVSSTPWLPLIRTLDIVWRT